MTNPLHVPLEQLRRGRRLPKSLAVEVELDELVVGTSRVPAGATVAVALDVEARGLDVVAYGTVTAPYHASCRRCLDDIEGVVEAAVEEVLEHAPTEGETYPLGHETVDLEPVVRDAVLLLLPLAPLCGDGCSGPDPERFPTGRPDEPDPGAEPQRDPRWAALDELTFDQD